MLQSLVDDNLVESDKIGIGNFFWALPSKAGQIVGCLIRFLVEQRNVQINNLAKDIESKTRDLEAIESRRLEAEGTRQQTVRISTHGLTAQKERKRKLEEIADLRARKRSIEGDLENLKDLNPELIKQLGEWDLSGPDAWAESESLNAKTAANRWTDNVLTVRKYCADNFNIEEKSFNQSFDIPEDFDYI